MNGCPPKGIAGYPNLNQRLKPLGIINPKLFDFYVLAVVGSEREGLIKYLDNIYGIGMGEALVNDENKNLYDDIHEYYSDKNPNLNDTVLWDYLEDDSSNSGLFSSIEARDCAKNYCINLMKTAYTMILNSSKKINITKKQLINFVFTNINNEMNTRLNRALTNIKSDDEYERVSSEFVNSGTDSDPNYTFEGKDERDILQFFTKYGNKQDIEYANLANTITMYLDGLDDNDYSDPIVNKFVDSLFSSNEISKLKFITENKEYSVSDNKDNEDSGEEGGTEDEFDFDYFITNAGLHLGDTISFTDNIPEDLKALLGGIANVINFDVDGYPVYDLNNPLGVISYVDPNSAWIFMLSNLDYTSPQTMLQSMINKAESIPGFGGFKEFAEGLVSHPERIYKIYNTFGNTIFNRIETQANFDGTEVYNTNMSADTEKYLTFEYLNTARSTTMDANTVYDNRTISAIYDILDNYHIEDITNEILDEIDNEELKLEQIELRQAKDNLIKYLHNVIGNYLITVDSTTIRSFINNNGDKNVVNNARLLLDIAEKLSKGAKNTYVNYEKRLERFGEIKANNEKTKKAGLSLVNLPNPYDVFKEDILDKNVKDAVALAAKYFKNFSFVKTELNSRNVYNNLSSDVLHNNMLSNLKMTLSNSKVLRRYGQFKLRDVQYNFSNIMLEQRDNSGNIIHLGLFKKDSNGIIIETPYANQLLQESLYNGGTNSELNKSATYQDMTHPDFIASGFVNFFSEQSVPETISTIIGKRTDIKIGTYFTRIPSDAPKIFCFTAPRYSAKNLFISAKQATVDAKVNAIMQRLGIKSRLPNRGEHIGYNTFNVATFINQALNPGKDITSPIHTYFEEQGKSYIRIKVQDGTNFIFARFTGEAIKDENEEIVGLKNTNFAGFESTGSARGTEFLINGIRDYIQNNTEGFGDKRIINTNHSLFQQLKNIFVQELTDAARAVDVIFEHDENGKVNLINGEYPTKYKKGLSGLYSRYHYNGELFTKDSKTGADKLTGNVFHSNRFTLFIDGKSVNFGEQLMNGGLFSILYGGDSAISNLSFTGTGNEVSVVLSKEQDAAINGMIEEYINALLKDTTERLSEYSKVIDSKYQNEESYLEYAINNQIMLTNYDDILEGNTKFYKNNQDILKRAKEHQGSGTPFGNTDYLNNYVYDDRIYPDEYNYLGKLNIRIPGVNHRIEGKPCFKAITVYNTQRTSEDAEALFFTISKNFRNQGYDDVTANEMAMTLIYGPEDSKGNRNTGFQGTKINDAQSYITLEEWIRRIYNRGDYNKYKDLIDKLVNPDSKITDEDITEFVQVQKNFYFDHYYDEATGICAPRQIKNAEFVLVPQFIKGTELEKVYDMMVKTGVDQLNTIETSKAANHKILTLWDNDRKLVDLEKFEKDIPGAIEFYNYNYLYVQQKTPQHMEDENKAGLQIMKKLIDNIPQYVYKDGKRTTHPLWRIKQRFVAAYCANIKESYEDLMNELGISVSPVDGTLDMTNINYDVLDEKLKVEALRKGLDDNVMDFITRDETGVSLMPSFMGVLSNKFQNIFQSLFNNSVTRQKLPGFHASQVTSLGLEQNIPYHDGPLRYHPDGKSYIEVLIPKPQSLKDIPNEEIFKKGEDGLNMLERAEVDQFIGYRIPTEGKQSVAVMKIVGFLDYKQGSTIVVPDDWVSQTGSDFDIDSVYGVTYNMWVSKDKDGNYKINRNRSNNYSDEENLKRRYINFVLKKLNKSQRNEFYKDEDLEPYDLYMLDQQPYIVGRKLLQDKVVLNSKFQRALYYARHNEIISFDDFKETSVAAQNTRDQRNAEILDCMIEIMSDPSVDPEVFHRSHFEDLTDAKERIMSSTEISRRKSRSPYNALDQAELQSDVMGGAKLKAISVTYDNLCSVCNNAQGSITDEIWIKYEDDKYNIDSLISRFGEDNVKPGDNGSILVRHNKVGWSNDNLNIDDQIITVYSSETTAHAVDAVKEGSIPNVNTRSFGIYKLFLNIGSNFDAAISFMMQPAVTRIANAYDVNESIYTDEHDYNPIDTSIKNLAEELGLADAKYKSLDEVLKYINENYSEMISSVWGQDSFNLDTMMTFSIKDQIDRIKNGNVTGVPIHSNFYSGEITANDPAIFVFGSNEIGVNGNPKKGTGGAALSALKQGRVKQGEIMNNRLSDNGRSYGLVTVHAPKVPLSNDEVINKQRIAGNIQRLYRIAEENPDKQFKIAYTNTTAKSLNGLTGREMANLFILADSGKIPANISFSEEWKKAGYFNSKSDIKQSIYDFGIMLQYKYLNDIAETHNNYARVVNPDKFGADKDLFNVRKRVKDIRTIINHRTRGSVLVGGQDMLETLYPGISRSDIDYYKNQYNDSFYPQLDYFLRYSTVASNFVNRQFLETEDENFVDCINGLEGWLKLGSKMSNELYTEFQRYVLSYVYNNYCSFISKGYSENSKEYKDEINRIYGYGIKPNIPFITASPTMPTNDEIKEFNKLSPAQKVAWIKQNFTEEGAPLFHNINVNLYNAWEFSKKGISKHSITYKDNGQSINSVYQQFMFAFANRNPFIRSAAEDLIRYAIVVEGGFTMKKNGISKIIKNKALIDSMKLDNNGNDTHTEGTSIVDDARDGFNQVINYPSEDNFWQKRYENFIRSHSTMKGIATAKNKKIDGKNIISGYFGVAKFDLTNSKDLENLSSLGIVKKNEEGRYDVVRIINIINENSSDLYKTKKIGTTLYMYPINKLEENEDREQSVIKNNLTNRPEEFYLDIINILSSKPITKELTDSLRKKYEDAKLTSDIVTISDSAEEFDLYNPPYGYELGFKSVLKTITDAYADSSTGEIEPIFIRSMALDGKPGDSARKNGFINKNSIQTIKINGENKYVKITKYNRETINKLINQEDKSQYSQQLKDLLDEYRVNKNDSRNIYRIEELTEDTEFDSSVTSLASIAYDDLQRRVRVNQDKSAKDILNELEKRDILEADIEKMEGKEQVVLEYHLNYLRDVKRNMERKMSHYMNDEDTPDLWYSIDSDYVISKISSDDKLANKFLSDIMEPRAYAKYLKEILDINIAGEDRKMQETLNDLIKIINEITNNQKSKTAFERYTTDVLAKESSNPLYKSIDPSIIVDVLDMRDQFEQLNWFESWISDVQEVNIPIVQMVLKKFHTNVRTANMLAEDKVNDYVKEIARIKESARLAGKDFNYSHFITSDGRFITKYNENFEKDYENLVNNLRAQEPNTKEYFVALNKLKHWKYENTHQQFADDYYHRELQLEDEMLNNHSDIFVKYLTYRNKMYDIIQKVGIEKLSPELQTQYNFYKDCIYWLQSEYSDPDSEPKDDYEKAEARALKKYVDGMTALNSEYKSKVETLTFRDTLNNYLNYIRKVEKRDENGIPTKDADILMEDEKYREAVNWIRNNAIWVPSEEVQNEIESANRVLNSITKIDDSYGYLIRKVHPDARDADKIIDGRVFTEEEVATLKKEAELRFNYRDGEPYSDKALIKNDTRPTKVYTKGFYEGMKVPGMSNLQYKELVGRINDILRPYYNKRLKRVEIHNMTTEELNKLAKLYEKLSPLHSKTVSPEDKEKLKKYINKNVNFNVDKEAFAMAESEAKYHAATSDEFKDQKERDAWLAAWYNANTLLADSDTEPSINHYIYGFIEPKSSVFDNYFDAAKTDAIVALRKHLKRVPTRYYHMMWNQKQSEGQDAFEKWYNDNHVYNPNTHEFEPLKIWTRSAFNEEQTNDIYRDYGTYVPSYSQTISQPAPGKENKKYVPNLGIGRNYKGSEKYKNNVSYNEYEEEAMNYMKNILSGMATFDSAKRFFEKGYLPNIPKSEEKNAKWLTKEIGKTVGLSFGNKQDNGWKYEVGYDTDTDPLMPMVKRFGKSTKSIPARLQGESIKDYEERIKSIKEENDKIEKENKELREKIASQDWEEVMKKFILKGSDFNARQENKYLLYYGLEALKNQKVFQTSKKSGKVVKNRNRNTYITSDNQQAVYLMENTIRRLLFDQWKEPAGKATNIANNLQGLASAKFMMMNITGGIANVTLGLNQIGMEAFAKEYFGSMSWNRASTLYMSQCYKFIGDMFTEKPSSLLGAIIKKMNVVEFDRITELAAGNDTAEMINKARELAYSPQSMGEHYMQNTGMLAMMDSHRVYKENGELKIGNLHNYLSTVEEQALLNVISNDENIINEYRTFRHNIFGDKNTEKDYALFKEFLTTSFLRKQSEEIQRNYIKERDKLTKERTEEFNKFSKLIDNFDFIDSELTFKNELGEISKEDAYKLLAEFKGKVISVNKKIHGVYDKYGAARMEQKWFGGIIMQYHKHIWPGLMKRYRRKGYWNEERQTVEKGNFWSLVDFLAIPFREAKAHEFTDSDGNPIPAESITYVESIQNVLKHVVTFATHFKLNYQLLPESEKANMRRMLGDLCGVVGAFMLSLATRILADDDDKEKLMYNVLIYEADRLMSESSIWSIGLPSEAKKLWSSPVAAEASISDLINASQVLVGALFNEDYDMEYQSGLYSGENKAWVLLRRQIPIYRSYMMLSRMKKNNSYYKLDENMLSIIPVQNIADYIKN